MQKKKEGWLGVVVTAALCAAFLWWLFLEPGGGGEDETFDPAQIVQDAGEEFAEAGLDPTEAAARDYELLLVGLLQQERAQPDEAAKSAALASSATVKTALSTGTSEAPELANTALQDALAEGKVAEALGLARALTHPERDPAVASVLDAALAQGENELAKSCVEAFGGALPKAVAALRFADSIESLEARRSVAMETLQGVDAVEFLISVAENARVLEAEDHAEASMEIAAELAARLHSAAHRIEGFLALAADAYNRVDFERGRRFLEQAHAAFGEEEEIALPVVEKFVAETIRMGAGDLLDPLVARRAEGSESGCAHLAGVEVGRLLEGGRPELAIAKADAVPAALGERVRQALQETPIPLFALFGSRAGLVRDSVVFDPDEARYVVADGVPKPDDLLMWELVRDGAQPAAYRMAWDREKGKERGMALLQFARMIYLAEERGR